MDLNQFLDNTENESSENQLKLISNELEALEIRLKEYKKLEQEEKTLKTKLYEVMEKYDVKSWETLNGTKITRVLETPETEEEVEEFNVNKFKEENEDLYTKYLEKRIKIKSGRSGYVKITLPKEIENE